MSLGFLLEVVAISASGALSPGPLTAVAATIGARRGWRSGLLIAMGHAAVELPLVAFIAAGLMVAIEGALTSNLLALAGGAFLLFFGSLTFRDAVKFTWPPKASAPLLHENPFLVGALLSLLNPFFIIWWLGVGSPLVYEAVRLWGVYGLAVMYLSHVWLDLAWLPAVTYLASLGRLNVKALRLMLFLLAAAVLYFGFSFVASGLTSILGL
ncbi:MAG: LysE family transporter [Candidatus Nezhaarchaeota archaeon]|nr:LysE family transporter [Candidatus Nezhaarchaeota archaeon]